MSERNKRNLGSSRAAVGCAALLFGVAFIRSQLEIDWKTCAKWIDVGSCLAFGLVLIWWALSKKRAEHEPHSAGKIGFETITMIVAVVTAVVAIFTLTDSATNSEVAAKAVADAALNNRLDSR